MVFFLPTVIYQWNFSEIEVYFCNYSVEEGRLLRLVCYCVVRGWSLISSRQQLQVGEYTVLFKTARRSVAYRD
ncbi:MAG: hypothetical protein LBG58_05670 [Planctomycetaceae bacterium]|nr:hypothetical protein [Planctomycetaceae bacterium]